MKHGLRGNFRVGHGAPRGGRLQYARAPQPRRPPPRLVRPAGSRLPPIRSHPLKRPIYIRDRRPAMPMLDRARRLPPSGRSYDRRPPGLKALYVTIHLCFSAMYYSRLTSPTIYLCTAPVYLKKSPRREYGRRDELPPPRSRAMIDYSPRVPVDRRPSLRDDYLPRGSGYSDLGPHSAPHLSDRRAYADDSYGGKFDRPLPVYREGRGHDYDTVSGSKRPYADMVSAVNLFKCPGLEVWFSNQLNCFNVLSRMMRLGIKKLVFVSPRHAWTMTLVAAVLAMEIHTTRGWWT
jgi:hypothetical protein